ncbi:hypothetical protein [Dactylosporangium sp. CA-233914]|uniref:hypothetical protein n=1 Tax=Dactylosporangium sp. CA-233914 TaxID=3239934 RepID=UPI003D8DD3BE
MEHGTAVELGARLSTRADRLDNATARWMLAHLPDVSALRPGLLPDSPRRPTVVGSVPQPDWADAVAAPPGPCKR